MGRRQIIDITGVRFGRLVVIERSGNNSKPVKWNCKCDCGNNVIVTGNNLKNGHTRSCGCLARENSKNRATKHNMCESRLCKEWYRMLERTRNTKWAEAHRYALRGITVCDEWKNSFDAFRDWALANGYDDSLSLDRIDNDKGYSPDNCRWANRVVQCRNKGNNVIIEYNGEKKTLAEWAEIFGIKYGTLHSRIYRDKMSPKEALEKPLRV